MYNFNFIDNEKLIDVFDDVLIKQGNNEKITTIALTDKRLLFLDYLSNDVKDTLRIAKGINYIRYKEVYYEVYLNNIKEIIHNDFYEIILKDNIVIEFRDHNLYKLLKGEI